MLTSNAKSVEELDVNQSIDPKEYPHLIAHLNLMAATGMHRCEELYHLRIADASVNGLLQRIDIGKTKREPEFAKYARDKGKIGELKKRLAEELHGHLNRELSKELALDVVPFGISQLDGMLEQNKRAANVMRGVCGLDGENEYGNAVADDIEEKSRSRWQEFESTGEQEHLWRLWLHDDKEIDTPFISTYCDVLLRTKVGPKWHHEETTHPSLTAGVQDDLITAYRSGIVLVRNDKQLSFEQVRGNYISTPEADDLRLVTCTGIDVASIFRKYEDKRFTKLSSKLAVELLFFEVEQGWQMWIDQKYNYECNRPIVRIKGGFKELADQLGFGSSKKNPGDLKDILAMQAHLVFHVRDYKGPLISLSYKSEELQIALGDPLLPDFYRQFRTSNSEKMREARKLVPIPNPRPPLAEGRTNSQGNQLLMSMCILSEMRKQSRKIVKRGDCSFHLPMGKWIESADASGIKAAEIGAIKSAWINGDGKSLPFLTKMGTDHYRLSEHHRSEEQMILKGGDREYCSAVRARAAIGARDRPKRKKPTR